MPGPVSDSYDPEFSTAANAHQVRTAIESVKKLISEPLGEKLQNIVDIAYRMQEGRVSKLHTLHMSEEDLRVIRFCLNRSLESI